MTRPLGCSLASMLAIVSTACSLETSAISASIDGDVPGVDSGRSDGGADDGAPADAPPLPCTDPTPRCAGGIATWCVSGSMQMERCALGCSTTDPTRCADLVPSNVDVPFSDVASDVDVDADETFDTDDCTRDGWTTRVETQRMSGPEVCVLVAGRVRVSDGAELEVVGSRPFVVLANRAVEINGVIDVSATDTTPGPGGGEGGSDTGASRVGTGPEPGQPGHFTTDPADHGGGGGGLCGAGGRGGHALDSYGGEAGAAHTGWDLEPLLGGSGGGDGSNYGGDGGAGGGALQISSAVGIRITGSILAGGGGGSGGVAAADSGAGGGGGSGGAVLLEAPLVEVRDGGFVRAAGGGGGGGSSQGVGNGGAGQDGAMAVLTATGGMAAAVAAGTGGRSGGGTTLDGEQGEDVDTNGGGGGGGAGCILVRTASGELPADLATASTPTVDPGLRALAVARD